MIDDPQKKPTRKYKSLVSSQKGRQAQLTQALKQWENIVVMPDDDIKSSEVVRPFIIMQPVYIDNKQDKPESMIKKNREKWNPVIEPPNTLPFGKEMNEFAIEKYPGKLKMSGSLVTQMQKRGAVYINLEEDLEYKSLYGEKNPHTENAATREAFLAMQETIREYGFHTKKCKHIQQGGAWSRKRAALVED